MNRTVARARRGDTVFNGRVQSKAVVRRFAMVESEHDAALEDTDRLHGRSALVDNVKAAVALAGAVRSTLGPRGLDKMLVEEGGSATVTNDGVTVLQTAKVEHPTARLLISTSSSQDRAARDGTTTTVILTAEMLQNALELVRSGVHPSIIMNGYQIALEEALAEMEHMARAPQSEAERRAVVETSLAGKIDSSLTAHLTGLALEAADALAGEEGDADLERLRVKRLMVRDGTARESEIVHGMVLAKSRMDMATPANSDGGRIAIVDGDLENAKLELEASIEVTSTGALRSFHERARERLQEQVELLKSLDVDLLVVRDGVAEEAATMLTNAGITAYRRFEREDLERLARITGSTMVRDARRIKKEDVGTYSSRSEQTFSGVKHTRIDGSEGGAMTVLIRGTSPAVREEAQRAFDDALGVAHRLSGDSQLLPGGGASQIHLARHLRAFAPSQSGREQLAIEAYAAALEIVPRTLAENSGLDPIDAILTLSAAQVADSENGPWIGLDVMSGEKTRMDEAGIIDPLFVVRHALSGATEAANSVLRIDDVLWAKQDAQTPDWQSEMDQD